MEKSFFCKDDVDSPDFANVPTKYQEKVRKILTLPDVQCVNISSVNALTGLDEIICHLSEMTNTSVLVNAQRTKIANWIWGFLYAFMIITFMLYFCNPENWDGGDFEEITSDVLLTTVLTFIAVCGCAFLFISLLIVVAKYAGMRNAGMIVIGVGMFIVCMILIDVISGYVYGEAMFWEPLVTVEFNGIVLYYYYHGYFTISIASFLIYYFEVFMLNLTISKSPYHDCDTISWGEQKIIDTTHNI